MGEGSLDPSGLGPRELLADDWADRRFSSGSEVEDATDGGWVDAREVCALVSGWAASAALPVMFCDMTMAGVACGGSGLGTRYRKSYQYLPSTGWIRTMWRYGRKSCQPGGHGGSGRMRRRRVGPLIGLGHESEEDGAVWDEGSRSGLRPKR